ncbi:2-oxoacid:acceptor oxidoreductase subunit alpha [Geothrix sp. PMB-07]|uniref:2-oxoacid:acceptor oxidoreductase subunit alpha n=1 Tax=Geothrix sp. PMB-07 TaxID=3068640 RepID=UPI002741F4E6|nr:2-oxoacid:acceptor oxidoreductase subunit alpha [Geothrix sp. PMB-07]WLT33025.1 2-oxoacid:acceptor oxidoreductase subunit alpha [Geothrix sp. PMB-07]
MTASLVAPSHASGAKTRINDFSIQVATVNGSGSQTANTVLLRAIFQMGVFVSGKNLFPSNIAGLPTWFTIRASAKGYVARKASNEMLILMNAETAKEDIGKADPGALVIYDEPLQLDKLREDLAYIPVPFQKLVTASCPEPKLHKLVKNMIYVGVAARLLGVDMNEVKKAITKQLKGKAKAIEINQAAAVAGYDWAVENLPEQDHIRVVRDNKTDGLIIVDGNEACALGALFAGVTVVGWYPITPASSLVETFIEYAEEYRKDPKTGKSNVAIVQMEDELASAGVVLAAGWAGARSMTSTAGPGVSLMSEFIGLGYYVEAPGVFFNVARTGPSTGLPTRTQQSDIELCAKCSHGDTQHINLYPGNMEECFQFAYDAFDLAERFQTPIFVVTDLDLGMQNWSSKPFAYPSKPYDRGKVLNQQQLAEIKDWGRYKDVDGDGICYRSLPGTPGGNGSYFTRGSGHNEYAQYSEKPEDYLDIVDRLKRKYETAKTHVPTPVFRNQGSTKGILAFGSSDPAVIEAQDILAEGGLKTDYLRLRALPFTSEVDAFVKEKKVVYVVEQNRDGQMANIFRETYPEHATKFKSVLHYNGHAIDAKCIVDQITAFEQK